MKTTAIIFFSTIFKIYKKYKNWKFKQLIEKTKKFYKGDAKLLILELDIKNDFQEIIWKTIPNSKIYNKWIKYQNINKFFEIESEAEEKPFMFKILKNDLPAIVLNIYFEIILNEMAWKVKKYLAISN